LRARTSEFDPEQKSEIKIVRISDTGTSLESGVRRLEPLRAHHYAVQAIGRGHIRELGRYSMRVLVKGFGLADTARISADPSITLLSQLSNERGGFFEVARIEAFGEGAVDRRKEIASLGALALIAPEAG
jgi:hypothetical protein